ncbi:MAG: methyl-accepting chemotaxis protein [Pseudolabrys sp.]
MPGEAGSGFAVVAQEVKGLATGKATEEITRHIVSIEQTTPRSVQAIKKIAATIEQLSDVANDVAVAMRQQDAVTQERRGKGHARCLRECQRGAL